MVENTIEIITIIQNSFFGGVAERFKAALLKSEVGDEPAVGSNPTSTAILQRVKGTATGCSR